MPAGDMPAEAAYQFIKDELALDGNPNLNLASFVTTYMEPEAEKLMQDNIAKNFIDAEEYPMSAELQNRCVNIIANLFNAPNDDETGNAIGTSTVGSSEAIILSTLALKRRWQLRRKAEGKSTGKPNLVMGSNVQVCWEKAVRYLEIESRDVLCDSDHLYLNPEKAIELVDENTIGVVVILGSTYTGHYEDAQRMNDLLLKLKEEKGLDVPIHVDAASGGFVAPFVAPDLVWDFRLPTVASINVSGHKYGLVYPGVGWAVWRNKEYLPEDLVFHINYLGSDQASFTLNFSKGASNVVAQYYMFIRLGFKGYKSIMENLHANSNYLADGLVKTGEFKLLSSTDPKKGLPVIAFALAKPHHFDEFDLAHVLRERQWIVPAYTMAPNAQDIKLLRIVLREGFTRNKCDILLNDIKASLQQLKLTDDKTVQLRRKAKSNWQYLFSKLSTHEKGADGRVSGAVC
ncbi:hypothetical protein HK097_008480 [Rhizophlyctis rosea]|uniref:Glutamate decarboxylase n=1 Tax=Rhizophlyctis rosea TaxID=64517 RepID=A0AAD5X5G6_9FUNG|nr:hypothetical protein HK097_008480 [Rhizophlyctis rosea]